MVLLLCDTRSFSTNFMIELFNDLTKRNNRSSCFFNWNTFKPQQPPKLGLSPGGGGVTWVFFGWVCSARDSKLAPRSKKNFPSNWYPVLEFALKLIPRSRNGPIFFYFVLECNKSITVCFSNALSSIFKSKLSLNNFKWLLTKLELSCVRNIIPRSRKRLWNGYPVLNTYLYIFNL